MSSKIKLTSHQKWIIGLMRGDYALKHQNNFGNSYWLSKAIGFDYFRSYDIRRPTFDKLKSMGLIKSSGKDQYKHTTFILTELGKSIEL